VATVNSLVADAARRLYLLSIPAFQSRAKFNGRCGGLVYAQLKLNDNGPNMDVKQEGR
jgi:hypothetical protein